MARGPVPRPNVAAPGAVGPVHARSHAGMACHRQPRLPRSGARAPARLGQGQPPEQPAIRVLVDRPRAGAARDRARVRLPRAGCEGGPAACRSRPWPAARRPELLPRIQQPRARPVDRSLRYRRPGRTDRLARPRDLADGHAPCRERRQPRRHERAVDRLRVLQLVALFGGPTEDHGARYRRARRLRPDRPDAGLSRPGDAARRLLRDDRRHGPSGGGPNPGDPSRIRGDEGCLGSEARDDRGLLRRRLSLRAVRMGRAAGIRR